MSEAKHTPLPWRVVDDGDDLIIWGDDFASNQGFPLARLARFERNLNEELANAHLIAAAPEMLKALEKADILLEHGDKVIKKLLLLARNEIKNAIAKAKGEGE